jgi:uncharacterized damage-inducible protein DinB
MAIKDGMIMEFKHEMANTRKMLERVPFEKGTYKPHEKSRAAVNLAHHVANVPTWIGRVITTNEFDVAIPGAFPKVETPTTSEELLAFFDKTNAEALKHLESATDEQLMTPWTFRMGGNAIFTLPKVAAIRNMALNHQYHHRGQLSVYLRLMDVPVPGMYGPSADEQRPM